MKPKRFFLLLLALCFLATACTPTPAVEISAPPSASAAPSPSPSLAPQTTVSPPPASGDSLNVNPTEDEYAPDELNGVADPNEELPSHESYEEAKAKNPDVIGWIAIDDTVIDYPVVRGQDNS